MAETTPVGVDSFTKKENDDMSLTLRGHLTRFGGPYISKRPIECLALKGIEHAVIFVVKL